ENELKGGIQAGGVLALTGLSVASLNSKGISFSLDDLNVSEGPDGTALSGPLLALKNLGVDLDHAGVSGLSGEIVATEGGVRSQIALDDVSVAAALDTPKLGLAGDLGISGISASVAIDEGAATIEAFHIARIDGAPTLLSLKDKGLDIDFPTLAVSDVKATGITLPAK